MTLAAPDVAALSRLLENGLVIDAGIREDWIAALSEHDRHLAPMLLHDAAPGEAGLTEEHGRVLTLHYASPEQMRGDAITVHSDVRFTDDPVLARERAMVGACALRAGQRKRAAELAGLARGAFARPTGVANYYKALLTVLERLLSQS